MDVGTKDTRRVKAMHDKSLYEQELKMWKKAYDGRWTEGRKKLRIQVKTKFGKRTEERYGGTYRLKAGTR